MLRTIAFDGAAAARGLQIAADKIPPAVGRGMRRIAVLVHRAADTNLSGPKAAWSYPVPRRSGDLARGMYSRSDLSTATIGNSAPHAWAVHSGVHPRWPVPPARQRPFLGDAAAGIDPVAEMQAELAGVL